MSTEVEKVVLELSTDVQSMKRGLDEVITRLSTARTTAKTTQTGFQGMAGQATEAAKKFLDVKGAFIGMVGAFSAANLVQQGAGALINFAKQAVETAGNIVDLSDKTGLSIRAVQLYSAVAKQAGGDIETYAKGIFKLGVTIAQGGNATKDALRDLGLSLQQVKALNPEQQFELIAKKLHDITDTGERNRIGVALYGKAWAEIAPGVVADIDKIKAATQIATDESVRRIDDMGDRWAQFQSNATAKAIEGLGSIVKFWEDHPILATAIMGSDTAALFGVGADKKPKTVPGRDIPLAPDGPKPKSEAELKREADERQRQAESLQRSVDALTSRGLAKEMREFAGTLELAQKQSVILFSQIPGLLEKIKAFEQAGIPLPKVLKDFKAAWSDLVAGFKIDTSTDFQKTLDLMERAGSIKPVHLAPAPLDRALFKTSAKDFTDLLAAMERAGSIKPVRLAPPPEDISALQRYSNLLSTAQLLLGAIGQTGSRTFQLISQYGLQATNITRLFVLASKAAAASRDAEKQALAGLITASEAAAVAENARAAASAAANAALTFGISLGVQALMTLVMKHREYQKSIKETTATLVEMGYSQEQIHAHLIRMGTDFSSLKHVSADMKAFLADAEANAEAVGSAVDRLSNFVSGLNGVVAPRPLKGLLDDILQWNLLADQARESLEALAGKPSWKYLDEGAEKFGVAREALGAGINTARLGASFDEINNFLTMATEQAGSNRSALLAGLADEMSALLVDAKKTGAALPTFMKPWVDELARAQLLKDELGNPIDPSGFSWTDDIKSSFQQMADYLKEIRDLLAQAVPEASVVAGRHMRGLSTDLQHARHQLSPSADAARFLERVKADVAQGLNGGFGRAVPAGPPVTGSGASGREPAVVKNYSGTVALYVGDNHLGDVVLEDMLRKFENNAGAGKPVGPTTRLAAALRRVNA